MPNGIQAPSPTMVVGVGDAGVKILVELYDIVYTQGYENYFKFIAIDSNQVDLDTTVGPHREHVNKIILNVPQGRVANDKLMCKYLFDSVNMNTQGAQRQRVVGRYLIDNDANWNSVYNTLKTVLDNLASFHSANLAAPTSQLSLNIWLLHSLGGGTGSGTFPLLAAMLNNIASNSSNVPRYFLGGVGVLPSAINLKMGVPGDPKYYGNAYAAMRELNEIINNDDLYIPLYTSVIHEDKLKVGKVFNKYFLVGINEDKLNDAKIEKWSERYADEKNRGVANAIYALHKYVEGLENWPVAGHPTSLVLGLLGQREISVRMNALNDLLKLKQELDDLEKSVEKMKNDLTGVGKREDLATEVDKKVSEKVNQLPEKISDSTISELCEDIKNNIGLVPALYGANKARELLSERKKDLKKDLDNKIIKYWMAYNLSALNDKYNRAVTSEQKMPLLKKWLSEEIIKLNNKLESARIRNPITARRLDKVKKAHNELNKAEKDYKNIDEAYSSIIGKEGMANKIQEEITLQKQEIQTKEHEIEQLHRDIENLETELSETKFGRVGYLQMNKNILKRLLPSQSIPDDLNGLITQGFIEEEDVRRGLETQIINISSWSDITMHQPLGVKVTNSSRQQIKPILYVLCHPSNQGFKNKIQQAVLGNFNVKSYGIDSFDKCTISCCIYFFKDVYPEYIQEYWNMHQLYENDKDTFSKIINMDVDSLGKIFAYPEWFPDDQNVQKVF
ncbi:MAG: tubulin-like doman-containing protein, partial [Methanosarcinales archaeon]